MSELRICMDTKANWMVFPPSVLGLDPYRARSMTPSSTNESKLEVIPKPKREPRVRPVPAVSRAIAILRLLGRNKQPMGVKAIADELDLVPSTCLHILRVLVAEDLVKPEAGTKRYTLGSGMISLARNVLTAGGFAQLSQPALDRIASIFGVTAMGVEVTRNQSVMVLSISRSEQPFRVHTDVGSQFSTLVSATGRLIAAYSGESTSVLKKKFSTIPWDHPPSFSQWMKEVEEGKVRGWCLDRNNFMNGISVLAVPVLSRDGRLTHTLVSVGLSSHLNENNCAALASTMKVEARALEELLLQ